MPDATTLVLFFVAASVVAVTPGPGIFYVLTRSLKGGRGEGIASSLGNSAGGLVHVAAASLGLSAVLMASATAFTAVKIAGGIYLVYLGVRTLLDRADHGDAPEPAAPARRHGDAFRQGVVVEALNPKTALFLLAFLPQFVDPQGNVAAQILLLGCLSVSLNTAADLVVAYFAGPLGRRLRESARSRRRQRRFTGCALIGLGAYVAVAGDEG
ncbi:LysE family translocator [Rubrobacter marinus]|uniref:LysE family translocator n=2 Tax=Rubrobacter marinus TaxID=2653852 RepID=A0A6G8Q2D9_9ACTN|nr:LysE family translocator [Rubrobacter marinus]